MLLMNNRVDESTHKSVTQAGPMASLTLQVLTARDVGATLAVGLFFFFGSSRIARFALPILLSEIFQHFAMEAHLGTLHHEDFLEGEYLLKLLVIGLFQAIHCYASVIHGLHHLFILLLSGLSSFTPFHQFKHHIVELLFPVLQFKVEREEGIGLLGCERGTLGDKLPLLGSELLLRKALLRIIRAMTQRTGCC